MNDRERRTSGMLNYSKITDGYDWEDDSWGSFQKTGMKGMITPESYSELLGTLGDKEKWIESDEFIYSKKTNRNFRTNARYFPFTASKGTHEQRKTKIDKDEFRSGTTNITHATFAKGNANLFILRWRWCKIWEHLFLMVVFRWRIYNSRRGCT